MIRRAREADIPALFRIRTAVRENRMSLAELAAAGVTPAAVSDALREDAAAWVAVDRARAIGFSMARSDSGDVFALFVLPEFEACGLGSRLLAKAERWLAARGIEEAWLLTGDEPGLRAPGFYVRRGWRQTGRESDSELRFQKRLMPPLHD